MLTFPPGVTVTDAAAGDIFLIDRDMSRSIFYLAPMESLMAEIPFDLKLSAVTGIFRSRRNASRFLQSLPESTPLDEIIRLAGAAVAKKTPGKTVRLESAERRRQLLFLVRSLSFCGIPYEQPEGTHFQRDIRMPDGTLRVTFSSSQPSVGVVYGAIDRKVLAWMCTQAVRNQNPRISFDSIDEILDALGMSDGGGYPRLYASLERWKRCTIDMDWLDDETKKPIHLGRESGIATDTGTHAGIIRAWRSPRQRQIEGSYTEPLWIDLSRDFFELLLKEPFPIPWEYLAPFADVPLQWDFAVFLAVRVAAARSETAIPLYSKFPGAITLKSQLGVGDSNNTRFTKKLEAVLEQIRKHWDNLDVEIRDRNLIIKPSKYLVEHTSRHTIFSAFGEELPYPTPPLLFGGLDN